MSRYAAVRNVGEKSYAFYWGGEVLEGKVKMTEFIYTMEPDTWNNPGSTELVRTRKFSRELGLI